MLELKLARGDSALSFLIIEWTCAREMVDAFYTLWKHAHNRGNATGQEIWGTSWRNAVIRLKHAAEALDSALDAADHRQAGAA